MEKKSTLSKILIFISVIAFGVWSAYDLELSPMKFIAGIPDIFNLIYRSLPPDLSILSRLVTPALRTLEVAIWGTFIAVVFSTILSFGAAKNLFGSNKIIYGLTRGILNTLRSIPDLIWALVFVAAVGLGTFPGVLALAVYSCGELGKLYAESIENIDPGPREALESTGAGSFRVIRWAILPQILPEAITYTLYRLESNVRHAFILGLVGAGGLGHELIVSMRLFRYDEALTIILVIIITVSLTDFVSGKLRQKVI
ncbi:phosphonate ABC transporter, permease protein PhnE [Chengkuizengella axinellae]|uniref:Phosphonate ABC transporter, permease protein PhnE n=1 Tax=Chengkuizengella axinellae TaxID=3064388 RepID=A0ABT9IZ71_9BACL|nr:phosphonate ABC transporter, permease protein PhnE [Chengkuizengella sp. 2205SS18-9]MDP5274427.1 phosphonate ABC transporter, permease protein PhnE [Chengkuizengella sp. 2205SS18-9]